MDESRIENLPRWAQVKFLKLEEENKALKRSLENVPGAEGSKISWRSHSPHASPSVEIPKRSIVTFRVPNGVFSISIRGDSIIVSVDDGCPVVQPMASNTLKIRGDRYWPL